MPVIGSIVPCFSFSLWYTLKCCCRAGWRELWHVAELWVDVWQEMLGAHFILSHQVRKNFLRKEKKEANWLQFSNDYIIYYSYTSGARPWRCRQFFSQLQLGESMYNSKWYFGYALEENSAAACQYKSIYLYDAHTQHSIKDRALRG
jgi:hypothetical protein